MLSFVHCNIHTTEKNYRKARAMVRKTSCESVYLRMPIKVAAVMLNLFNQRNDDLAIKAQIMSDFGIKHFRDVKAYRFWVYGEETR